MKDIKATYKEWRRLIVAAIRCERMMGLTPKRNSGTATRPQLALELRMRRSQLISKENGNGSERNEEAAKRVVFDSSAKVQHYSEGAFRRDD